MWALRYRENLPDGGKKRRSVAIGTVEEFPTEPLARKAALSWLFSMNAEPSNGTTVSFGAVIQRYLAEEIPERPSTASRYRCWLKNHVEPKWRDYPIEQIKPLLVEDWLKKLNLAPKSKSHLKNLMRVLFNAAMRWELIPYQHNPMITAGLGFGLGVSHYCTNTWTNPVSDPSFPSSDMSGRKGGGSGCHAGP